MADENKNNKNTVLGVDENIEALLCYAFGWVTGLVFLLLEKNNQNVRFHAMQSLIVFLTLWVGSVVLVMVPLIGPIVAMLTWPFSVVLWIILMLKAYQGGRYKLPVVGDIAEKQLKPPAS